MSRKAITIPIFITLPPAQIIRGYFFKQPQFSIAQFGQINRSGNNPLLDPSAAWRLMAKSPARSVHRSGSFQAFQSNSQIFERVSASRTWKAVKTSDLNRIYADVTRFR
jgi:hypothetical protein